MRMCWFNRTENFKDIKTIKVNPKELSLHFTLLIYDLSRLWTKRQFFLPELKMPSVMKLQECVKQRVTLKTVQKLQILQVVKT